MIEAIAGMITANRESPSIFLIPELYPSKRLEQLFYWRQLDQTRLVSGENQTKVA
jgi:hypothetical protein